MSSRKAAVLHNNIQQEVKWILDTTDFFYYFPCFELLYEF